MERLKTYLGTGIFTIVLGAALGIAFALYQRTDDRYRRSDAIADQKLIIDRIVVLEKTQLSLDTKLSAYKDRIQKNAEALDRMDKRSEILCAKILHQSCEEKK